MDHPKQSTAPTHLGRLWQELNSRRRLQILGLFILMISSALFELVSFGAMLPFLAAISNADELMDQPKLRNLATSLDIRSGDQLLITIALTLVVAVVVSALIRILNLKMNGIIAAGIGNDLSGKAFSQLLHRPYQSHLLLNSSDLINTIVSQTNLTVLAIAALLQMSTAVFVSLFLIAGLMYVNWIAAGFLGAILISAYAIIGSVSKRRMRANGRIIDSKNAQRVQIVQEGLGAIRDIIINGSQDFFVGSYCDSDLTQRKYQARNDFLVGFPRYFIEATGLALVVAVGVFIALSDQDRSTILPLLGTLAIGSQKLLPSMQQIYLNWGVYNSYKDSVSSVLSLLSQSVPRSLKMATPRPLKNCLELRGVGFRYAEDGPMVLTGLNLKIEKGQCIGLIGPSGSGKSTVADIIMGLLPPVCGRLIVDDIDVYLPSNARLLNSWRLSIAHVPQTIYLSDQSIAQNIALGVPLNLIDFDRIRYVAAQARLSSYIESTQMGYSTIVGERGIRLSGGQRQRIGIARALYRGANTIVLDEATSALDVETERDVIETIKSIKGCCTIIMIAHRLSTLEVCDHIYRIQDGKASLSKIK